MQRLLLAARPAGTRLLVLRVPAGLCTERVRRSNCLPLQATGMPLDAHHLSMPGSAATPRLLNASSLAAGKKRVKGRQHRQGTNGLCRAAGFCIHVQAAWQEQHNLLWRHAKGTCAVLERAAPKAQGHATCSNAAAPLVVVVAAGSWSAHAHPPGPRPAPPPHACGAGPCSHAMRSREEQGAMPCAAMRYRAAALRLGAGHRRTFGGMQHVTARSRPARTHARVCPCTRRQAGRRTHGWPT